MSCASKSFKNFSRRQEDITLHLLSHSFGPFPGLVLKAFQYCSTELLSGFFFFLKENLCFPLK